MPFFAGNSRWLGNYKTNKVLGLLTKGKLLDYSFWEKRCGSLLSERHPILDLALQYRHCQNSHKPGYMEIAGSCDHPRHPSGKPLNNQYCSVCTAEIHIAVLDLITQAWKSRGDLTDNPSLCRAYRHAWSHAKKALANWTHLSEYHVYQQKQWELANPGTEVPEEYSLAKALENVRVAMETRDPGCKSVASSKMSDAWKSRVQAKDSNSRTVRFAPDTLENDITRSRPRAQYQRSSKGYKPGKHACPHPAEWLDTSGYLGIDASLGQCKVFVSDKPANIGTKSTDIGAFHCHLADYKHSQYVLRVLKREIEETRMQRSKLVHEAAEGCDAILLVKPTEKVVNGKIVFHVEGIQLLQFETDASDKEKKTPVLASIDRIQPLPERPSSKPDQDTKIIAQDTNISNPATTSFDPEDGWFNMDYLRDHAGPEMHLTSMNAWM